MIDVLTSLKSQFAGSTTITALVGGNCSFLMELQETTPPFITYNIQEFEPADKDGSRDYTVIFFVIAKTLSDLLTIYEAVKTVMDSETTDFLSNYQGSTFPDSDKELDGNFIIELTYSINK